MTRWVCSFCGPTDGKRTKEHLWPTSLYRRVVALLDGGSKNFGLPGWIKCSQTNRSYAELSTPFFTALLQWLSDEVPDDLLQGISRQGSQCPPPLALSGRHEMPRLSGLVREIRQSCRSS